MNEGRAVRLVYFAWVREKVGRAEETIALPPAVTTVEDLIAHLSAKGPEYADAFATPSAVRAAVDKAHAKPRTSIAGAREIAFFPPVTGG